MMVWCRGAVVVVVVWWCVVWWSTDVTIPMRLFRAAPHRTPSCSFRCQAL